MSRRNLPSLTRWLRGVTVVSLVLLGVVMTAAPSVATTSASTWSAHLRIAGNFGQLIPAEGNLYAVRYASHGPLARGSQLVRVDPTSGTVLRVSRIIPGLSGLTFIHGSIWADGVTFYAQNAMSEGPSTLVQIDPFTLVVKRQIVETAPAITGLVAGPHDELWAYDSTLHGCSWERLNPVDGIRMNASLTLAPGQCGGETIDSWNNDLYVATNTQATQMTIFRVNAATGAIVGHHQFQTIAMGVQLLGVGNSLWVTGSYPGSNGMLLYINATTLQQIQGSQLLDQNVGATDQKAFQLPSFGQYPSMTLSGGVLWVGSAGASACFRPTDWHEVSSNQSKMTFYYAGDFSVINHVIWSSFQINGNGFGGLGIVQAPADCRQ